MELEYIKKEVEDFDLKNSLNSKCLEVAHLFVRKEINKLQDIDFENIYYQVYHK